MIFWHQKIWLGDGDKPGQSIYWDTKEKRAYIGESSKLISAKKSKNNGLYAGIAVVMITLIIGIFKLFNVPLQISEENEGSFFWPAVFILFYSFVLIYFMNRFFYHRHAKYTETTLARARTAIKTHSFYGADWKALFILLPVMYVGLGAVAITAVYVCIEALVAAI